MTVNSPRESFRSVFRRRDLRPIWAWARENIDLKPPLTETGPFKVETSRHFIEPLEALQDDEVREVNILKPVRGGGTLIADIWVPWMRENDPGPTMFLLQTDPIADDHFTKVLLPTMQSVPKVRSMLDSLDRFKKTGRKIEFSDGNHLHVNGPSIGNLQTNAFRNVILDECWLYPDRMADAEARIGDFQDKRSSKVLRVSQGGPKDGIDLDHCSWNRAYNRGSVREWEVQCPHCLKYYQPIFSGQREDASFYGITWDKHKHANGDWDLARCIPTIRFECPHCSIALLDTATTKDLWNRSGRYRLVSEENRTRKSFHWETIIKAPWDEMTLLWLDACNAERRGDLKPKLQFYQKRRAMHKDEESLLKGGLKLKSAPYEIKSEWKEERERFLTIDRQEEDLLWWEVRAWSTEETRQLGFGKCYGFAAAEKLREDFKVLPNHTFCDSGYLPKGDNGVYTACIKYGWIALKGEDDYHFVHRSKNKRHVLRCYSEPSWGDPGMGTGDQGRKYCRLVRFSKSQMNEIVQRLHDAGRWIQSSLLPADMQREYQEQFGARVRMREFDAKTGKTKVWWKEAKNDHGRDLANMQALGGVLTTLVPDPATERLTNSEEKADKSDMSGVTETAGV